MLEISRNRGSKLNLGNEMIDERKENKLENLLEYVKQENR
jgi:hypothetical protein